MQYRDSDLYYSFDMKYSWIYHINMKLHNAAVACFSPGGVSASPAASFGRKGGEKSHALVAFAFTFTGQNLYSSLAMHFWFYICCSSNLCAYSTQLDGETQIKSVSP